MPMSPFMASSSHRGALLHELATRKGTTKQGEEPSCHHLSLSVRLVHHETWKEGRIVDAVHHEPGQWSMDLCCPIDHELRP